jgi:hypothetical protein
MSLELIKTEDLPKGASISEHLKSQAKYFARITFFGISYYIPVTKEMKKIFGISIIKGEALIKGSYFDGNRLDDFLRDLISVVYLQVRDTVGAEIRERLSDQIKDGLEKMFQQNLSQVIESKLTDKMLPNNQENHV